MSPFFIIFVDMGRYFIIGTAGFPTYLSVDGIVGIMQDSRNRNTKLFIYYSSGKQATITLKTAVLPADIYKWANWFIDKFSSAHNSITTVGSDWETVAEATTIGGPQDPATGQYPSTIPFNDSSGNPIEISSITIT